MMNDKVYSSHPLTYNIHHYGNDGLLQSGRREGGDLSSKLAFELLEEENKRLQKKKDELARKTAEQRVPSHQHLIKMLEAEKISLQSVIEQRETIIQSYHKESNSGYTEAVWNGEREKEHYTRRFNETYSRVSNETKERMDRNLIDIRNSNMLLQQQNESFIKEIERLRKKRIEDVELLKAQVEQFAHGRVLAAREGLDREMRVLQSQAKHHKEELTFIKADLEERRKKIDQIWAQAKSRNNELYKGGLEYEIAEEFQSEHLKQIKMQEKVSQQVSTDILIERDELEARIAELTKKIGSNESSHKETLKYLSGSFLLIL